MRLMDALQRGSLDVAGRRRAFLVAVPTGRSETRRYPIVVMLHGGMGTAGTIAAQTGLFDYVDRDRFIAVFPDAGGRQWNDGRPTTLCDIDDVAFLAALVRYVATRYGGDPDRAFLAGGSNGGMMTQRVACEAPETFRAYAAVLANLPAELLRCTPSRPVPILFILSTDDPEMPWNGGKVRGAKRLGREGRLIGAGGRVLSAADSVGFFARANGCGEEEIGELQGGSSDGTGAVRVHRFPSSGGPVVFYEIHGGGHGWPGSHWERDVRVQKRLGAVSREIDATQIILDFFKENGLSDSGAPRVAASPELSPSARREIARSPGVTDGGAAGPAALRRLRNGRSGGGWGNARWRERRP